LAYLKSRNAWLEPTIFPAPSYREWPAKPSAAIIIEVWVRSPLALVSMS
jgi:hypothetical protein